MRACINHNKSSIPSSSEYDQFDQQHMKQVQSHRPVQPNKANHELYKRERSIIQYTIILLRIM
jgi:hypothetical protein